MADEGLRRIRKKEDGIDELTSRNDDAEDEVAAMVDDNKQGKE